MFKNFLFSIGKKINKIATQKQNQNILQHPTAILGWHTSENMMKNSNEIVI